jgi:hypothetical protein
MGTTTSRNPLVTVVSLVWLGYGLFLIGLSVYAVVQMERALEIVRGLIVQLSGAANAGGADPNATQTVAGAYSTMLDVMRAAWYVVWGCIAFVGLLISLGGWRTCQRRGRVLTFLFALLYGLASLGSLVKAGDARTLAIEAGVLAFSVLTIVVLFVFGKEFRAQPD